jgi:hypothetical protein
VASRREKSASFTLAVTGREGEHPEACCCWQSFRFKTAAQPFIFIFFRLDGSLPLCCSARGPCARSLVRGVEWRRSETGEVAWPKYLDETGLPAHQPTAYCARAATRVPLEVKGKIAPNFLRYNDTCPCDNQARVPPRPATSTSARPRALYLHAPHMSARPPQRAERIARQKKTRAC